MTVVISDTSVLCYLTLIGEIRVLESLFGSIVIPKAVLAECVHPGAPESLRMLFASPTPPFIQVAEADNILPETRMLDAGEAAAISLAWHHRTDSLLLLDEKRGRAVAQSLGLRVRGILGIMVEGHRRGLLDFDVMVTRLRQHGFRIADSLLATARQSLGIST